MAKSKNQIAYEGLKSVGHNWAKEPYDPSLYYEEEWQEYLASVEEEEWEMSCFGSFEDNC